MVDCLHRAMRPASRPVITPLIVDPTMMVTIMGRASTESQAEAPSSAPNAAPSITPSTGLLTVTLGRYSTWQHRVSTPDVMPDSHGAHTPPLTTVHISRPAAINPDTV